MLETSRRWLLPALLSLASACSGDGSAVDAQLMALSQNFDKVDMKKSEAPIAEGNCKEGRVDGIHTLLCSYKDAVSAGAAREAALERIGSHTGLSLTNATFLLVAYDDEGVDPHGKTLNAIAKTFMQKGS